jgi:hypothetical protein
VDGDPDHIIIGNRPHFVDKPSGPFFGCWITRVGIIGTVVVVLLNRFIHQKSKCLQSDLNVLLDFFFDYQIGLDAIIGSVGELTLHLVHIQNY